jgi:hypothetical protein
MTETDLAYIAGLFDGESCIRIKRTAAGKREDMVSPQYRAMIHIHMVDEAAIRFISETLGGNYYREKPHCNRGRPLYRWQAGDAAAERILRALLPYLRVKRASAENVLALRDLKAVSKQYRTKVVGYRNFPNAHGTPRQVESKAYSDEYLALCESLCQRSKQLNSVGCSNEPTDREGPEGPPDCLRK